MPNCNPPETNLSLLMLMLISFLSFFIIYYIFHSGLFSCRMDYDDSGKPSHLANSAVLRLLEEEEQAKRQGYQPGKWKSFTQ